METDLVINITKDTITTATRMPLKLIKLDAKTIIHAAGVLITNAGAGVKMWG